MKIIDCELSPNPNALKFINDEMLLEKETRFYKTKEAALEDPLAKGLMDINGVKTVFYMNKFITVEKEPNYQWKDIQKQIIQFVNNFDKKLIPIENPEKNKIDEDELLRQIRNVIEESVIPALANDGGSLEIVNLEGYNLHIKYLGACGNCPSSIRGTLTAIQNLLQKEVNPLITVLPV
jgi:Fe-S cluster biogenesis protein NfuA